MKNSVLVGILLSVLWGGFRILFSLNNGLDEVLVKPLIFFSILYLFHFLIEKKLVRDLGVSSVQVWRKCLIGAGAAAILIVYKTFIFSLRSGNFSLQLSPLTGPELIWAIVVSFATACTEELVFRGYIQQRILEKTQNIAIAIGVSNFFFVLIHIPRAIFVLHMSAFDLLSYLLLLSFLGIINSLIFWRTKNIAAPITTHWLWNTATVLFK
jgi:membrane protease YdiL (CAAX protease family)